MCPHKSKSNGIGKQWVYKKWNTLNKNNKVPSLMHTCGRTCAAGVHFCQGFFVLVFINHMFSIAPFFTYGFLHLFRIFSILLVLHFPIEACYCNTYMYILLILLMYNVSISTHHWLVIYTRASIEFLVPQNHSVFWQQRNMWSQYQAARYYHPN